MKLTNEVLTYIRDHQQEAYELLLELAQIPAPSNHEQQRAEFCRAWLTQQGAEGVYVDDALNVVYPVGCDDRNDLVVFMAHSDVVFPDTDQLLLRVEDGRIYCPGVGDDTANAVALLMAAKYIAQQQWQPKEFGVLLVINSGEEGLGNLKGCRKIMGDFGHRVREFIALDGQSYYGVTKAVGSRRYRIEVTTEGGHSYANFGNRNAIAYLASLITKLYQVEVPKLGRTTYNVGTVSGGTSVNTIAQQAQMLYEFRSDERAALDIMQQHFDTAVAELRTAGVGISVTLVGDRPCGASVDELAMAALMEKAQQASLRRNGRGLSLSSGSTDCNIPLSMGIPAICVGCYRGGGAHTREEYVDIDSLHPGMEFAFDLILGYF